MNILGIIIIVVGISLTTLAIVDNSRQAEIPAIFGIIITAIGILTLFNIF